jgi:hypothetical protein
MLHGDFSSAVDSVLQLGFSQELAHDRLGGGRTTDMAHAHEANCEAGGIRSRELFLGKRAAV